MARAFQRYVGIDYSGAKTSDDGLPRLRVFRQSNNELRPTEVLPSGRRKSWSRREVANWLVELLNDGVPTIVAIDHSFSFPLSYFDRHNLPYDWSAFLKDFREHWPTDKASIAVEDIRRGLVGNGTARVGSSRWRRRAEEISRAKSVFHFDVPGSVAKSTHAGLPWLLYLRKHLGCKVHFWPFDGWQVPKGRSVIAEAYPSLYRNEIGDTDNLTGDRLDAYAIAKWLWLADGLGKLPRAFEPDIDIGSRLVGDVEGWILGVGVD